MIYLSLIRTFIKPILVVITLLFMWFCWKYYNHLQQSIGGLEQTIEQRNQVITDQKKLLESIEDQVKQQTLAINDLQRSQARLSSLATQRQLNIKETIEHDQSSKVWAAQPVPVAIRGVFNTQQITGSQDYEQSHLPTPERLHLATPAYPNQQ